MKPLAFDIETIPDEAKENLLPEPEAAKNIKDPEKIKEDIENELNVLAQRAIKSKKQELSPIWELIVREPVSFCSNEFSSNESIQMQIRKSLESWLNKFPGAIKLGEDIQNISDEGFLPYGGAFKVTGDLSDKFPGRVLNTPISEAAVIGCATGVAISGGRSSVEIMFGDFSTLIIDQLLQHSCKFKQMFGRDVSVPINVRTPMGGRRGYGATHSQSLEHLFIGIPNLSVFSPNHRIDLKNFYEDIYELGSPTFIAEHKLSYTLNSKLAIPPGYEILLSNEKFPTVLLRPLNNRAQLTLTTYGYGLFLAEKALAILSKNNIWVELLCPSRINSLNADPILKSTLKTGMFASFEEGSLAHGFGAMVYSYLGSQGVRCPKGSLLIGNDSYVPAAINAEMRVLPDENVLSNRIIEALKGFYG